MGLQEETIQLVPWADSSVSSAIASKFPIYGLSWGFNYRSFFINWIHLEIGEVNWQLGGGHMSLLDTTSYVHVISGPWEAV